MNTNLNSLKNQHWTFDKKINVGHIITTLTVALSVIVWALSVEKRVSANELNINKLDDAVLEVKQGLNERLNRIENKLDRLIEKNLK